MKTCTKCHITKSLTAFTKNAARRDGLDCRCQECIKGYIASRQQQITVAEKRCSLCGLTKPAEQFGVRRASVDGLQFKCKECVKSEAAAHRAKDPENAKSINRRWYAKHGKAYAEKNREKLNTYNREHRRANPERSREAVKAWAARNPESASVYYAKNAERLKPIRAKHYQNNKSDYMTRRRNKRVAVQKAGRHTTAEVEALFAAQQERCANLYCDIGLTLANRHLDHRVALSRGGSNTVDNLQWLCAPCNLSKFTKDEKAWLAQQDAKLFAEMLA